MEVELPSEPAPRRGVRLVDSLSVATVPCRGHMAPARWHHGCARYGAKIIAIHWMTAHRGHHRTPRRSGWLPERPNVHPVWVTALRKKEGYGAVSKQEAIAWAKRCPASGNEIIEVRQVQEFDDFIAGSAGRCGRPGAIRRSAEGPRGHIARHKNGQLRWQMACRQARVAIGVGGTG